MNIERVTIETASLASHIYAYSWKTGYKGIVPQTYLDELSVERWTPKLGNSIYKDFILSANSIYAATSTVSPARDKKMDGWGEIISLYVLPAQFRKGYGKSLFNYVINELHADGFSKIYLWVLEDNQRARAFYEKMGFYPNGDRSILDIGSKSLVEVRYVNCHF